MRIMLKLVIDCDVNAAWRALHSPRAIAEPYGPLVDVAPLQALPPTWEPGEDAVVALSLSGIVPLGRQLIDVNDIIRTHDGERVRILRDTGLPLSGPLAALDVWDHQMAVSPAPGDPQRTLWRDRLVIGGRAAPLLWPVLWAAWQWRAGRIRTLARTWAHDPETGGARPPAGGGEQGSGPSRAGGEH